MQSTTKRTGRKYLSWQDRNMMETLVRRKWPFKRKVCWAELGRDMGRPWRSVKDEYLRGKVTNLGKNLEPYGTYSAEKGQQKPVPECENDAGASSFPVLGVGVNGRVCVAHLKK